MPSYREINQIREEAGQSCGQARENTDISKCFAIDFPAHYIAQFNRITALVIESVRCMRRVNSSLVHI